MVNRNSQYRNFLAISIKEGQAAFSLVPLLSTIQFQRRSEPIGKEKIVDRFCFRKIAFHSLVSFIFFCQSHGRSSKFLFYDDLKQKKPLGHKIIEMFRENQVLLWSVQEVVSWAESEKLSEVIVECLEQEQIDGCCLIHLTENDIRDFRYKLQYAFKFSDIKKLSLATKKLINNANVASSQTPHVCPCHHYPQSNYGSCIHTGDLMMHLNANDFDNRSSPPLSVNGRATSIPPELFKTAVSIGECDV